MVAGMLVEERRYDSRLPKDNWNLKPALTLISRVAQRAQLLNTDCSLDIILMDSILIVRRSLRGQEHCPGSVTGVGRVHL